MPDPSATCKYARAAAVRAGTGERMNKIQPFSTGTEYMCWNEINCCHCRKYNPDAVTSDEGCDIEIALSFASIGDGTIPISIADRAGRNPYQHITFGWKCTEFEQGTWAPPVELTEVQRMVDLGRDVAPLLPFMEAL